MAGPTIGRYELEELVSRGGMGEVWRARDVALGRLVAIKLLFSEHGEAAEGERFLREARAAARLSHPNIVATYDVGRWDDRPYLVMEYLDGPSMAIVVEERHWLSVTEIGRLGAQVASALACAHAAGVVHRDIKPGNLVMTSQGTVKLVDFGLAWLLNESAPRLTPDGTAMGTTYYLAPEVATGKEVDERSDLYSLGCVLYELTCGRPPFLGAMPEVITAHLHDEPEPPSFVRPGLPDDLEALILHLLAKQPEHRPTDAAEVNLRLRRLVGSGQLPATHFVERPTIGESTTASPDSGAPTQPQSRHPKMLAAAMAAATLVALTAWWTFPTPSDNQEQAGRPEQSSPTVQPTTAGLDTPSPRPTTSRPQDTGTARPNRRSSTSTDDQRTTDTATTQNEPTPDKPHKKPDKKPDKPDKKPGEGDNKPPRGKPHP